VVFENNTAKSAVVDVHDTVYRPTTLSKFEIYFEEKDRRCGTHRHHDFVRRWFLPAGSRISRRRRHADRCQHVEWFKYRYNLKDSQVMKNTFACVCASQSMGMEVKHDFQYDSRLIMPFFTMLSPRPSKRSATRERDAKTGVMAARRYTTAAGSVRRRIGSNTRQHADMSSQSSTVVTIVL
jgi:hypothetical protein